MENKLLETSVTFLKGVGPQRAELLAAELKIESFADLIQYFPFRYVDKTKISPIASLHQNSGDVVVEGYLTEFTMQGDNKRRRLVAWLDDGTGRLQLVWFKAFRTMAEQLQPGLQIQAYGRINFYGGRPAIAHPEWDVVKVTGQKAITFEAVYNSTDKLKKAGLDSRGIRRIMLVMMKSLKTDPPSDPLPDYIRRKLGYPTLWEAYTSIHFPKNEQQISRARERLKFEELFLLQLRLLQIKSRRQLKTQGYLFEKVGEKFNRFYHEKLEFELTGAQKKVMKEIRRDLGSGRQMNRLLQGDVGSGKTVVALMAMLIAIDNGYQVCLMAPTEILATQHYNGITEMVRGLGLNVAFLSGSVKARPRKALIQALHDGTLHILIGTHAVIEDPVQFKNLGLAIIDEQHRFGVKQRAALWNKGKPHPPHILVMTATPIPRTLAMSLYGDLDVSVIDEMPPGRKAIKTIHQYEYQRYKTFDFIVQQVKAGRQVYIVYPLIEESEAMDLNNLNEGYDAVRKELGPHGIHVSVVHGRMKPADKAFEMERFVKNETQVMVATTVIEVGVNVPNASIMVIENAERFGLSQLHQLRGRVGRGAEQSFCILMTNQDIGADARKRIETMVKSQDGFHIAEVDMQLRGPGNIEGVQQSGLAQLKIADLNTDGEIVRKARQVAQYLISTDPEFKEPRHQSLENYLKQYTLRVKKWSRIS